MRLCDYPWDSLVEGEAFDIPETSYSIGYVRNYAYRQPANPGLRFSVRHIPDDRVYEVSLVPCRTRADRPPTVRPARGYAPRDAGPPVFEPDRVGRDRTFEPR